MSKLTLLLIFGQVEAEKIEVKETRGHFYFSHEYVQYHPVSAVVMILLDFKNLNLTSCITVCDNFHKNDPALNQKKIPKILILKFFGWNYSGKWLKITWKCENWKWPLVSLTSIFSASSAPNVKSKNSFEKLRMRRFQNWPS